MSDGINRVSVLGNLGADPELRFTQGGQAVLNMRVAATTSYLDKEKERKENTEWYQIVVWGARGEALAKILNKGDRVYVEGEGRTSSYDKDGAKHYKFEVSAKEVVLCGGSGAGKSGGSRNDDRGRDDDRPARGRDDDREPARNDDRGRNDRDRAPARDDRRRPF